MDIVSGEITGIAFGGNGILRQEGLVIFVPFTAPGDRVKCQIIQKKKNFALAKLLHIEKRSSQRIEPLCPYFGTCGGCQLQHLNYEAQLAYKKQCVEDALKRIGHLTIEDVLPVVPSNLQWAYRRHITLTLKPSKGFFEAGYITINHHSLLPILQCPIFIDQKDEIIKQVQYISKNLQCNDNQEGKAYILKQGEGHYLIQLHFKKLPENCKAVIEKALLNNLQIKGIMASSASNSLSFGNTAASLTVDQMMFQISPRAFIQNHPEQSLNIYHAICQAAQATQAKKILDLYCGIGILSLMLAKKCSKLIGIEFNQTAIDLAIHNAGLNNIQNALFYQGDVQVIIKEILKKHSPDFVVINPPRTGMDPHVVHSLLEEKPKEIIYISCMPSTLARDLKILCENAYRIQFVQPYDMFPQTAHVETIAHLKLISA